MILLLLFSVVWYFDEKFRKIQRTIIGLYDNEGWK